MKIKLQSRARVPYKDKQIGIILDPTIMIKNKLGGKDFINKNDEYNSMAYKEEVAGVFISSKHPLYNQIIRSISDYNEE